MIRKAHGGVVGMRDIVLVLNCSEEIEFPVSRVVQGDRGAFYIDHGCYPLQDGNDHFLHIGDGVKRCNDLTKKGKTLFRTGNVRFPWVSPAFGFPVEAAERPAMPNYFTP